MKILTIPDIHLKPNIFKKATRLMNANVADNVVCLMDIPDDWGCKYNIDLYEKTYDEAIKFSQSFPNALWCWGNHDLSYRWNEMESGFSNIASPIVNKKILELLSGLKSDDNIKYVHKIDNVLFSHGGLAEEFVREYVGEEKYDDVELVLEKINSLGHRELWFDISPIWCRPQYGTMRMYKADKLLQVVGHTPVEKISRKNNVISCDVFSTFRDGSPIGIEEFLIIDTKTWEFGGIKDEQ